MKYKVGDKVRIKSLDWYNENKDNRNEITFKNNPHWRFVANQSDYCGQIATIISVSKTTYRLEHIPWNWTDEMIEGLVEEETKPKPKFKVGDEVIAYAEGCIAKFSIKGVRWNNELNKFEYKICSSWYDANIIMKLYKKSDNMETEIHRGCYTTDVEITNESKKVARFTFWDNDFADKVELDLSNRELIQEDGKWFVVKKKKEYPKTYLKCCDILKIQDIISQGVNGYLKDKLEILQKLLICRDAYWKLYGEEMGLGKSWEPDWKNEEDWIHCITTDCGEIYCTGFRGGNKILAFPTEEMRDAFKENFDADLEICKELL